MAATILGTLVAVWRPPGKKVVAAVQHFAAGVVIAALAGEVLPDLKERENHNLVWTAVGFALGVLVMLVLGAGSAAGPPPRKPAPGPHRPSPRSRRAACRWAC